jgi:hypothetical protein
MSLRSVLATMTYKPTFHFEVVDVNGSDVLRVTMATHDSRPSDAPPLSVPVEFGCPTDWEEHPRVDDFWREWVHDRIRWCELHESAEWLRFDGELYRDPHEQTMHR